MRSRKRDGPRMNRPAYTTIVSCRTNATATTRRRLYYQKRGFTAIEKIALGTCQFLRKSLKKRTAAKPMEAAAVLDSISKKRVSSVYHERSLKLANNLREV
jgi:hypothetical protein